MNWLRTRALLGGLLLTCGIVLLAVSLASRGGNPDDTGLRVIGGFGIAGIGVGIGLVARYGMALRSQQTALRVMAEERDERSINHKQRAGQRAYWTSAGMIWLGLMCLPEAQTDGIWNLMVAALVIPFAVYVGSIVIDARKS
jgi:hypothetical protein